MGLKVLALVLWGLSIIITCAGLWNAAVDTHQVPAFYVVASVVAFAINVVAIIVRAKSVSKEYEVDKK